PCRKPTTNFLCLGSSSLGQNYCSMRPIFDQANRSLTSPLDLEQLQGSRPCALARRDASLQPTLRSQCWILPKPRVSHQQPQLRSLLLRCRREHSTRCYVSKDCSSFQIDSVHRV